MESSGSGRLAPDAAAAPKKRDQARQSTLIALGVLVAIFALLNLDEVKVNFIITTTRAPLIIVVVACLAAGIAIGMIAGRRRD